MLFEIFTTKNGSFLYVRQKKCEKQHRTSMVIWYSNSYMFCDIKNLHRTQIRSYTRQVRFYMTCPRVNILWTYFVKNIVYQPGGVNCMIHQWFSILFHKTFILNFNIWYLLLSQSIPFITSLCIWDEM